MHWCNVGSSELLQILNNNAFNLLDVVKKMDNPKSINRLDIYILFSWIFYVGIRNTWREQTPLTNLDLIRSMVSDVLILCWYSMILFSIPRIKWRVSPIVTWPLILLHMAGCPETGSPPPTASRTPGRAPSLAAVWVETTRPKRGRKGNQRIRTRY